MRCDGWVLPMLALALGCSSEPSPPVPAGGCADRPVVSDARARVLVDGGTPAPMTYAQALVIAPNGDIAGTGVFGGQNGAFRLTRAGQLIRLATPAPYDLSDPAAMTSGGGVFGRATQSIGPFTGVAWGPDGTPTPIPAPDQTLAFLPSGTNDSELVPGTLIYAGGVHQRAAVWRQGVITNLGTLGPDNSQSNATAVNAAGVVVGASETSVAGTMDVFTWTAAVGIRRLGRPGGTNVAMPVAINGCGLVSGTAMTPDGTANRPWRWSEAAGFVHLPLPAGATTGVVVGMDSLGVVYGNVSNGGQSTPYVWYRDRGEPLPGGSTLVVRAVNACGTAVGTYQQTDNDGRIATWTRPGC